MARKTGQIIRRGSQMWMVRIYVGRDPESGKRKYIGKSIHGGLPPHWPTSTRCSRSGTSAATSAPPSKPSASISITGSISVPGRGYRSVALIVYEYVRPFVSDAPRDLQNGLYKLTFDGRVLSAQPRNGGWASPTAT